MALSITWDNSTPAAGDAVSEGDDRIRDVKAAVQERADIEHIWNDSSNNDQEGMHKWVTIDKSANYTCTEVDHIIMATGGVGGITITINPALETGKPWRVIKDDTAAGAVTVALASGAFRGLFDGLTSCTLEREGDYVEIVIDGTDGIIKSHQLPRVISITDADSPYQILESTEYLFCHTNGGAIALTLPTADNCRGQTQHIILYTAGNELTFTGSVDGATPNTLTVAKAGYSWTSSGTVWSYTNRVSGVNCFSKTLVKVSGNDQGLTNSTGWATIISIPLILDGTETDIIPSAYVGTIGTGTSSIRFRVIGIGDSGTITTTGTSSELKSGTALDVSAAAGGVYPLTIQAMHDAGGPHFAVVHSFVMYVES